MESVATPAVTPGAIVDKDGDVRCGCGSKVGRLTPTGPEFWCRKCKVPVPVSFKDRKLEALVRCVSALEAAIHALNALETETSH